MLITFHLLNTLTSLPYVDYVECHLPGFFGLIKLKF
ncbi:TPA: hypothetical protein DIC40_06765 [Patescibacteria group bacterium]|nr:hypothetical protein [Candidatus Gracilibacteria bacterium]